jgi:hypothetical protein
VAVVAPKKGDDRSEELLLPVESIALLPGEAIIAEAAPMTTVMLTPGKTGAAIMAARFADPGLFRGAESLL